MHPNEILAQAYRDQMVQQAEHARLVRLANNGSSGQRRWSLNGLGRIFSIHPWRSITTQNAPLTQRTLNARIR